MKEEIIQEKSSDQEMKTNDISEIIRPLDITHHKSIIDRANIKVKNVNVKIRVKKGEKFTLDVKKETASAEEA